VRTLQYGEIGGASGVHPGVRPEPALHPLRIFKFKRFGDGRVGIIFKGVLDIRRITKLLKIIAQTHSFNESKRELGLFATFKQLQHFTHSHARRQPISSGLKVRERWLHA
jgi:hypothetical protein